MVSARWFQNRRKTAMAESAEYDEEAVRFSFFVVMEDEMNQTQSFISSIIFDVSAPCNLLHSHSTRSIMRR
jgi:hypothetical protein